MIETPVPDSVSAVQNITNATRDAESELESGQDGKAREIVIDNIDRERNVSTGELCLPVDNCLNFTHADTGNYVATDC